jgi:uncharacterized protein YgiM (DUF1202 family)
VLGSPIVSAQWSRSQYDHFQFPPITGPASRLAALPDNGPSSCALLTFSSNRHAQGVICSATLINSRQILLGDDACLNNASPRHPRYVLSCNGDRIRVELNQHPGRTTIGRVQLLTIPESLSVLPPNLPARVSSVEQRQALLDQGVCELRSPQFSQRQLMEPVGRGFKLEARDNGTVRPILNDPQRRSRTLGAQLICLDTAQEETLVGLVDTSGNLQFIDQLPQLAQSPVHRLPDVNDPSLFDSFMSTCHSAGDCLQQLSSQSRDLLEDTRDILAHLTQNYQETLTRASQASELESFQELHSEFLSFNLELTRLLAQCQEIRLTEIHRNDGEVESGRLTGTRGFFENAYVNVGALLSSDYILNQFKDVPILQQNLSENRMRQIIEQVERDHKDLSQIRQIARSAQIMTNEVIGKFIDDMKLADTPAERTELLERVTGDFNTCIEQARHSGHIDICAKRISTRAPGELARVELGRQLEANFKELYVDSDGVLDEEAYNQMLTQANAAYQQCLLNYYYSDEHTEVELIDKARACVYESLLIGYREGSQYQIDLNLKEQIPDPVERARRVREIRLQSQNCSYGNLFHQAGSYQAHHYHTLSRIDTDTFERELKACSKSLMHKTGEATIRLILQNDASVQSSIPAAQREAFQERAIRNYYEPCMEWIALHQNPHPRRCEAYITHMVTVDVAKELMNNTIAEQVLKLDGLPGDRQESLTQTIQTQVADAITSCQEELQERHRRALNLLLRRNEAAPVEQDLLRCLNQGIGIIAEQVTTIQVESTLRSDELLTPFADTLLERDDIQALPGQVRACLQEKVLELGSVQGLDGALEPIIQACALEAEKSATLIAAGLILEDRLAPMIRDPEERAAFIQRYLEGESGLRSKITAASTPDELKAISQSISGEVALLYAQSTIPNLVSDMLEGKASAERQREIQAEILTTLASCIEEGQAVDYCANQATRNGNLVIASEIIQGTLNEHLAATPGRAQNLGAASKERLEACLNDLALDLAISEFNQKTDECVASEVRYVSGAVPRELLLTLSPLLGGPRQANNINQRLLEVEQALESRGSLTPAMTSSPLQSTYGNLLMCLRDADQRIRSGGSGGHSGLQASLTCNTSLRIRRGPSTEHTVAGSIPCNQSVVLLSSPSSGWVAVRYQGIEGYVSTSFLNLPEPREAREPGDIDLEQYLGASDECTERFESEVTAHIRRQFINTSRPGRTSQHARPLGMAVDTLLLLQGKPTPGAGEGPRENNTLELMNMVAEQVIATCNYNQRECEQSLQTTRTQIERFRERNPNATSAELQSQFIRSPFIDKAIEANITTTLSRELNRALADRFDNEGILRDRVSHITSPEMMRQILNNRYGQAAREYIRNAIENGRGDSIDTDPRLRMIIASAVTDNLNNGGFVDELMYGLVQPELNRQRSTTRVGIGNFFGVVSKRNFNWHRLRDTPEGQEARRIFARNLLEPMFQGRDLGGTPSPRDGRKTMMDDEMDRIEKLIEQGIRGLSR